MKKRYLSTGILFMVLVAMLAAIGVGYAMWSKTLTINGTVNTGEVDAEFVAACTDDDGAVDCPGSEDADDTGLDPAETGPDPKLRYDKDVGDCAAAITMDPSVATMTLNNVYPSYHCTAWYQIHNSGTIPVNIKEVRVNGIVVTPSVPEPIDLNADTLPDITVHITDIVIDQQIDPSNSPLMNVDVHVLPDAPPATPSMAFDVEVDLAPWNQP